MKFSIITVSKNSGHLLRKTFESVLDQALDESIKIEYVLVDAVSTDRTMALVTEYTNIFKERGIHFKFISEPDDGIYDAMNKALNVISGEYFAFLGAGDYYLDNRLLITLKYNNNGEDFIFGDDAFEIDNKILIRQNTSSISWLNDCFLRNLPASNESIFYKTDKSFGLKFDLQYHVCSDFNFFIQFVKRNLPTSFLYIPCIFSVREPFGVSNLRLRNVWSEYYKIVEENNIYKPHFISKVKKNIEIGFKELTNKLGLGKSITVRNLSKAGFVVSEKVQCSEKKTIERGVISCPKQ